MGVVRDQQHRPSELRTSTRRSRIVSLKCLKCLVVIEVADVLADEGLPIDHQRDGVLEIGAHGEQRALDRQSWPPLPERSRVSAAESPDRRRPRAPRNRRPAARWGARRPETHRPRLPAARRHPAHRRQWVRWSGWRWSSPAPPARRRQTADDAPACTAASRRDRHCRERRREVGFSRRKDDRPRDGREKLFSLRRQLDQLCAQSQCR